MRINLMAAMAGILALDTSPRGSSAAFYSLRRKPKSLPPNNKRKNVKAARKQRHRGKR